MGQDTVEIKNGKRLTERVSQAAVVYIGEHMEHETGDIPAEMNTTAVREVLARLAAYEDTGLMPEDLQSNVDMDLVRFAKLLKADAEGRLEVLPCKVGDWVYAMWDVPTEYKYVIYCAEVKEICRSVRNCRLTTTYRLEPVEYRGRRKEYRDDDFGKLFFLTCEEAEKAVGQRD